MMSAQGELFDSYVAFLETLVALPRRRREILLELEQQESSSAGRKEQDLVRARSDHANEVGTVDRRLSSARAIVQSVGHPELIPSMIFSATEPDGSSDFEHSIVALDQAAISFRRVKEARTNETSSIHTSVGSLWSRFLGNRREIGLRGGLAAFLLVVLGSGFTSISLDLALGSGVHLLGIFVGVLFGLPYGDAVGDAILSSTRCAGQVRSRVSRLANYCMCVGVSAIATGLGGIVSGFDEPKVVTVIGPIALGAMVLSVGFEQSGLERISKENPRIVPPIMWDGVAGVAVSFLSFLLVVALRETEGSRTGHAVGLGLVIAAASIPTFGHLCRSAIRGLYQSVSKRPVFFQPGSVVWTRIEFEDEPSQGKDRPVLVVGSEGTALLVLALTSKAKHDRDDRVAIGSGPWDPLGRTSHVKLSRMIKVNRSDIRRTGGRLDPKRLAVVMRHAAIHHPQLGAGANVKNRELPKVVKSLAYAASWAILGLHLRGIISSFG